jgi:tyrosinase
MSLSIMVNGSPDPEANYLTWSESPLALAQTDTVARTVRVRGRSAAGGGQLQFRAGGGAFADEVQLVVPAGNQPAQLSVAGKFPSASSSDGDVAIVVVDAGSGAELSQLPVMVRIRKNANDLSAGERDRFLSALVRLNTPDAGNIVPFLDIQNMHTEPADREIHGRACFLPWHRAYLLDLERRLQRIDPSVALPYWRFDQPAPNVFTRDFMGVPLNNGVVDFSATNPLINWVDRLNGFGSPRVRRYNGMVRDTPAGPRLIPFDPTQQRAIAVSNGQDDTINLGLGGGGTHRFTPFSQMESDPHGSAHVSFYGQIMSPATAPADPLFFLLHCNVDRLWARWQWLADRYDDADPSSYAPLGNGDHGALPGDDAVGNFSLDTMWPWNRDTAAPRPPTAPGGQFPRLHLAAPSMTPTVAEMIDFQGQRGGGAGLGFGYIDVPLE